MRAPTRAGGVLGIAFGLLLQSSPGHAQNGDSFADAQSALVPYTNTPHASQKDCAALVSLTNGELAVLSAERVPRRADVPEHCRVSGVIPSEIVFEVNLPLQWNGRLYMYGNGGFAGNKPAARGFTRDQALRRGFATAHTNTGHDAQQEPGASFARDNLAKTVDYAFRAVHLTVLAAKGLIGELYERRPAHSYWDGCSTGGRQGLMSAQRFAEDFDGIVAGAPVIDFTGTMIAYLWNSRALAESPVSRRKVDLLARKVYGECDAIDGLEDGLIDDPRRCQLDLAADLPKCGPESRDDCFTSGELATIRKIYDGPRAAGGSLYPGTPPGAEIVGFASTAQGGVPARISGWEPWLLTEQAPNAQLAMAESFVKYMAFDTDDARYEWTAFDFDADPQRTGTIAAMLNATDPDLSRFRARGGKMLTYFGWADAALNPYRTVAYYEGLQQAMGSEPQSFYRLFMVPGMFHCSGGAGADHIDAMTAVIDWVEAGKAPDRLVGRHLESGAVKFARPHCPYPQIARYRGTGSRQSAESFVCSTPRK